jgi:LPXTG-motif cell wall-anchored protein
MYNRRITYVVCAVTLMMLLGLSGLGIASAQSGTTTNVKITETEFKLEPATITVPANTPVQFTVTNAGTTEHNLSFALPAQNMQKQLFAQNLKPGETKTATFTFTAAGDWQMFCPVDAHAAAGMKGTVMVVAAQGAMASATARPAAGATPTPASPRALPVTGGEPPTSALVVAGLVVIMAGLGLRRRRSA